MSYMYPHFGISGEKSIQYNMKAKNVSSDSLSVGIPYYLKASFESKKFNLSSTGYP